MLFLCPKEVRELADSFGVKMGIEGEKEFKNALKEINAAFKVLGSEMNLVTSQFDKNEKSIESLTSKNEVLNKEIDTQKEKVETLRSALENASDSFGEADRRTQAWQVQLNNAQAELNKMEHELSSNEKAIDEMGDEFNQAEKEVDQFGDELEKTSREADSAGGKFSKLGSVVKGAAAAMGAALAAVGTAVVAAGKEMVNMTVEAAAYADEMLTQSSVTGMSVESLQAYSYAADLVDVSLDTMTTSMAKNIKSMSKAAEGSKSSVEAYEKLGVKVTDASGALRDSEDVYWEVIDGLGKISNETERDALAMQLFGKSAQDLNPLIAQGSDGIAKLTEEAKAMGAVMSEESIEKLGAFDDSVQRLTQGSEAAKRAVGTILLPQLQSLADEGVTLLGEFTNGLVNAGGDFGQISEVIGNTIGGLAEMIVTHLPDIVQVGLEIVTSIGSAIVENLPTIIECASTIVTTLLQGLIEALPAIGEGALQLLLALVQGIIENLPKLVEAAIQLVVTLANGIAEALPELIPAIVEAIVLIATTLLDHMDEILQAAFAIIEGLAKGLIEALPVLMEALPELITAIVNFVTENLPEIIELGITLVVELTKGLIQAIPELVKALPQIVMAILEGIGKAILAIGEIGVNIVKGLWEGICSMGSWLYDQVAGFVNGIVENVKSALQIHSPSKVFADIGNNMALGMGVGFSSEMKKVSDDMQNAIPTDFDTAFNKGQSGGIIKSIVEHVGTIRVEGINQSGELTDVVDIIVRQLKQEVRA